jgi:hypothetical protein
MTSRFLNRLATPVDDSREVFVQSAPKDQRLGAEVLAIEPLNYADTKLVTQVDNQMIHNPPQRHQQNHRQRSGRGSRYTLFVSHTTVPRDLTSPRTPPLPLPEQQTWDPSTSSGALDKMLKDLS